LPVFLMGGGWKRSKEGETVVTKKRTNDDLDGNISEG